MLEKAIEILEVNGIIVFVVCSFHPYETVDVIGKIVQKYKNIRLLNLQSDKMVKKDKGYLINPDAFKEYGGSDIFFISVIKKIKDI